MNADRRHTTAHGILLVSIVLVRTPAGAPREPVTMEGAAWVRNADVKS